MSKLYKQVEQTSKVLKTTDKRMLDLYNIIFRSIHDENILAEYSTMTRKLTFTYGKVKQNIELLAKNIIKTVGKKECFIGLHGENSVEWIIAFWAILKSGNKPYLINLRQPRSFSEGILNTLKAIAVIVCNSEAEYSIKTYRYSSLSEAEGCDISINDSDFANEFALSTSGTTLKEKICIYKGEELSEQILNLDSIIRINPRITGPRKGTIKMLAFLPMYHIFGLEAMYFWFTIVGSTFVFLNDWAPENILRTIRNHEITHVFAVPLLWHAVEKSVKRELAQKDEKTKKKFEKYAKRSLKLQNISPAIGTKFASLVFKNIRNKLFGDHICFCITGGSFIKPSAVELLNSLGYPLCNGYGMTEIGICSVELSKKPGDRMLCSIGKPFDSLEYRIGNDRQLLVKGSSVCGNIITNGVQISKDEWFDTGDIVSIDEKGRYYIEGRHSDVVFGDNGENLNPDYAEKEFELRDALQITVLGNEDNSKLRLIVRIPKNLIESQKNRLRDEIAECNAKLPSVYNIAEVKFTFDPLMEDGGIKVSRAYVKKAIAEKRIKLFDLEDSERMINDGDDSEIKQIVRELFAEILEIPIENIKDDMHFLNDLGGTSLDYFTLINELDTRFNLRIDFGNDYDLESLGYTVNHFEKIIKELIA